jgi:HAMP domain-containing protein
VVGEIEMAEPKVLTRATDNPRTAKVSRRRIDRLLVTAIVAALGLSGLAIWQATSRHLSPAASHASASSASSPPPAVAPTRVPESAFASQPAFTGAAVTKYGQPALQKAYRQLVNFAFDTGWDATLMAKRTSALTTRDFAAVRILLTPSCAKAYDANVTKALAGDKAAISELEGSMYFAIGGIDATGAADGIPTISNRSFTRAKFTVDTSHGQRLSMSFTAKATVHTQDAAGKRYFVQTARALHYLLVPNHGADANIRPFLIDAWASRMPTKTPQPA